MAKVSAIPYSNDITPKKTQILAGDGGRPADEITPVKPNPGGAAATHDGPATAVIFDPGTDGASPPAGGKTLPTIKDLVNQGGGQNPPVNLPANPPVTQGGTGADVKAVIDAAMGAAPASPVASITLPDAPAMPSAPTVDTNAVKQLLSAWQNAANYQAQSKVDYATNQAAEALRRAEQDAQAQFKEQAESVAIDERQGMDNSALYAEARGDKGGIGQAQYNAIQAAAAQNRLAVQQQQTKLSTDTARQIADLRAQGEFEKADAVLETAQAYLSKLVQLEQWAAEYGMSAAQFEAQMAQWQAEYDMAMDKFGYQQERDKVADAQWQLSQSAGMGKALLAAGVMPSDDQLKAMGMTVADAQAYLLAAQMPGTAPVDTPSPLGNSGAANVTELYNMLKKAGVTSGDEALSYLTYWGVSDPKNYMAGYEAWLDGNGGQDTAPKSLAGIEQELDILVAHNGYSGAQLLGQILSYGLDEEDTLALAKKYGL